MVNAIVIWGGDKPTITYKPSNNQTKVAIKLILAMGLSHGSSLSNDENKSVEKNDRLL